MASGINRLPASFKSLKPGMHCDGGNLYLQISLGTSGNRRRSWIFRYVLNGQAARDMGLGSANDTTLAEARETARQYRNLVKQGIDPISRRDAERAKNLAANIAVMTFNEAARTYICNHRTAWKSAVHAEQWESSLRTHASPKIGKMSVADIELSHVMKVLESIWLTKPETASRLRGRIESILGWATVSGSADVRKARHADIDRAGKVWIIPSLSKTGAEHRVPLSTAALAVFDKARSMPTGIGGKVGKAEFIFPNDVTGAALSQNAMLTVLDRMGRKGAMTTHGCRASLRTWAQEQTNFPWELAEMSLGHRVGSKVERAYARGDAFKKRIAIMQAWSSFCGRPVDGGKVVQLQAVR